VFFGFSHTKIIGETVYIGLSISEHTIHFIPPFTDLLLANSSMVWAFK